jgi:hypothetical protein
MHKNLLYQNSQVYAEVEQALHQTKTKSGGRKQ